jgi:predicted DNA-binding protein with PD1-like motif
VDGHFEIVSLVGTVGMTGSHLHLSISDGHGRMLGGHLLDGCLVYTTAEIVMASFPNLVFRREMCENSGYPELVIYTVQEAKKSQMNPQNQN